MAGGGTAHLYGIANVTRELMGETTVLLATTPLMAEAPEWTADLGLGGAVSWAAAGRETAIYGEIRTTRGISGGDLTGLSGNLGVRVTW
jgi:outer membrane autotransporter protein